MLTLFLFFIMEELLLLKKEFETGLNFASSVFLFVVFFS